MDDSDFFLPLFSVPTPSLALPPEWLDFEWPDTAPNDFSPILAVSLLLDRTTIFFFRSTFFPSARMTISPSLVLFITRSPVSPATDAEPLGREEGLLLSNFALKSPDDEDGATEAEPLRLDREVDRPLADKESN